MKAPESDLIFYTHPMSRACIVRWMLEESGASYTDKFVALGSKITDVAFLRLNPMGKVPVIVHGEQVVTESAAICAYLADAFPQAGLAPDASRRGAYYRWLFFGAGCLEPAAIDQHLGVVIKPEQEGMVGYRSLSATLDAIESQVQDSRYIAGDEFSAADVYMASQLDWGHQFGTIERRPGIVDYVERTTDRPAAVRARQLDEALAKAQGLVHP